MTVVLWLFEVTPLSDMTADDHNCDDIVILVFLSQYLNQGQASQFKIFRWNLVRVRVEDIEGEHGGAGRCCFEGGNCSVGDSILLWCQHLGWLHCITEFRHCGDCRFLIWYWHSMGIGSWQQWQVMFWVVVTLISLVTLVATLISADSFVQPQVDQLADR